MASARNRGAVRRFKETDFRCFTAYLLGSLEASSEAFGSIRLQILKKLIEIGEKEQHLLVNEVQRILPYGVKEIFPRVCVTRTRHTTLRGESLTVLHGSSPNHVARRGVANFHPVELVQRRSRPYV